MVVVEVGVGGGGRVGKTKITSLMTVSDQRQLFRDQSYLWLQWLFKSCFCFQHQAVKLITTAAIGEYWNH